MIEEFKRPTLEDQDLINGYFKAYPSRSCDRTFANVYLWSRHYGVEFLEYKNTLLFSSEHAENGFAFPAGKDEDVRKVIPELIQWAEERGQKFYFYGVTTEMFAKLEEWFPGKFQCEYQRDDADYVYEAESLATLSGKKLHGKRNHINKFKKTFEGRWQYEKLTKEQVDECLQMALRWRKENGCDKDPQKKSEICVALNSLRLLDELHLVGGLLRLDGEVVAFTLGEPVNEDTFIVHIEKAYAEIDGAYPMINQQFVEHELLGKYKYVNREEDVGVEGLRKAKLSYRPAFLIEKGYVTLV